MKNVLISVRGLELSLALILALTLVAVPDGAATSSTQFPTDEAFCRACHEVTADTHHLLVIRDDLECLDCHSPDPSPPFVFPVIRDCIVCHDTAPHPLRCELCHTDQSFVDNIGNSREIHDIHKDRVICGICHAIPESIEFGPPATSCGQMCHSGKQRKPAKELHGIHMSRFGILPIPCYWCHGESIPDRPTNSCDLCHDGKSADAATAHKRHGKDFECTTCHVSVAGFGPDVRFDSDRSVCMTCHNPKFKSQFIIHEKHLERAQCYACHGDSDVYASFRGERDCTICHDQRSSPFFQAHQRHAGQAMMCTVCHSLVPPNVDGIQSTTSAAQAVALSVNQAPVARAGTDRTIEVAEQLFLSAVTSYDPDGVIENYLWKLGDGTQVPGMDITYSYKLPGTYIVTLTVIDNDDTSASDDLVVRVKD